MDALDAAVYGLVIALTWLANEATHYLRWKQRQKKEGTDDADQIPPALPPGDPGAP